MSTTTQATHTWVKLPSTRRENRFFYHCSELRQWVLQDWQDNLWRVVDSADKIVAGPFATAKAAIAKATSATA